MNNKTVDLKSKLLQQQSYKLVNEIETEQPGTQYKKVLISINLIVLNTIINSYLSCITV